MNNNITLKTLESSSKDCGNYVKKLLIVTGENITEADMKEYMSFEHRELMDLSDNLVITKNEDSTIGIALQCTLKEDIRVDDIDETFVIEAYKDKLAGEYSSSALCKYSLTTSDVADIVEEKLKEDKTKIGFITTLKDGYAFCDNIYLNAKYLNVNLPEMTNKLLVIKYDDKNPVRIRARHVHCYKNGEIANLIDMEQVLANVKKLATKNLERQLGFQYNESSMRSIMGHARELKALESLGLRSYKIVYEDSSPLYGGRCEMVFQFNRKISLEEFKAFLKAKKLTVEPKACNYPIRPESVSIRKGDMRNFSIDLEPSEPCNVWSYKWHGEWDD